MESFQILAITLFALIAIKIFFRYKKGEISLKIALFWFVFWLVMGGVVILPETTSLFANYLGIGRGVDLAVYIAIVLIFYVMFLLFLRIEKLEKYITKLTVKDAISNPVKRHKQE